MSDKISYSIEYDFHASKQMLFQYLSTPSGLGEWFADNVNSRGESFTFIWDDAEEYAKLLQKKNNERVRFQWSVDEEEGNPYYFEFKIQVDDLTNDVSVPSGEVPVVCLTVLVISVLGSSKVLIWKLIRSAI